MEQYVFLYRKKSTVLLDKPGVITGLCGKAEREGEKEHCALALARQMGETVYEIFDFCTADEIGGSTGQNLSTIPRRISLALIRLCIRQGSIPVILHTHDPDLCPEKPVFFSRKDEIFMEHFSQAAVAQGLQTPCLFLVTNGRSILLCETGNMTRQYARKEGLYYV